MRTPHLAASRAAAQRPRRPCCVGSDPWRPGCSGLPPPGVLPAGPQPTWVVFRLPGSSSWPLGSDDAARPGTAPPWPVPGWGWAERALVCIPAERPPKDLGKLPSRHGSLAGSPSLGEGGALSFQTSLALTWERGRRRSCPRQLRQWASHGRPVGADRCDRSCGLEWAHGAEGGSAGAAETCPGLFWRSLFLGVRGLASPAGVPTGLVSSSEGDTAPIAPPPTVLGGEGAVGAWPGGPRPLAPPPSTPPHPPPSSTQVRGSPGDCPHPA